MNDNGSRILVVDDEINIRGAPGDACSKRNGYQVRGAGTGEEALAQLETARLILFSPISRCREWAAWNFFAGSSRNGRKPRFWS